MPRGVDLGVESLGVVAWLSEAQQLAQPVPLLANRLPVLRVELLQPPLAAMADEGAADLEGVLRCTLSLV